MIPNPVVKKKQKPVVKHQRCQYTAENLENAINSIKNAELSINKASQQYNVPKSTLILKLNQNQAVQCKLGRSTILTTEEEVKIKNWILNKAKLGFPMCRDEVKDAVQQVLKETKRVNPFTDDRPGRKWMGLFLNRHPEISLKNSEILSKARASVTEEGIRGWFAGLKDHIKIDLGVQEIFDSPERIINLDELGMSLCPKTGKILRPRGEKNLYKIATGMEKQSISVLCYFSEDGNSLDPMIIYAHKKMPRDIAASLPEGFAMGRSDTGWINSANFYQYIANVLYPRLVKRGTKFPVLILCDGHKSHINIDLHRFCVEKQIILYCLLANLTHILQPCDVGIFYPLKAEWKKVVASHSQKSTAPITKVNFAVLFKTAFDKAVKSEVIKKAFEACGLFPFNPDRVDYSKCMSTRHRVLREEMSQTHKSDALLLSIQDNSSQIMNTKMLMMIEAQMPIELVKEFIDLYESNKNPLSEILLYNIWKNLKDLVISNLSYDPSTVEAINQTPLENSTMSLPDDYEIYFDDSLHVINEQDLFHQYPAIPCLPSNDGNSEENSENDVNINSSFTESFTGLDQLNNNHSNGSNKSMAVVSDFDMSIEDNNISNNNTSHNTENMDVSVDTLSQNEISGNNLSAENSEININKVWEKLLHYPKIDNKSKNKSNKISQIHAITSHKFEELERKKLELEIKEKEVKLQRQAERDAKKAEKEKALIEREKKKEERLLQRKIIEEEKIKKREQKELNKLNVTGKMKQGAALKKRFKD